MIIKASFITGPAFLAGVFRGIEKRQAPDFQTDSLAPYKIMGISTGFITLKALNEYIEKTKPKYIPTLGPSLIGGFGAGLIVSGTVYCLGLLLTKIPPKDFLK